MILPGTDPQAIDEAARRIQAGGLVGFPTETVYGLGADASSDTAVAGIFAAKGRPATHPLIVHVADAAQVNDYASSVPPFAARLMQAFWPGPLTVILPRRDGVAAAAAGGQNSIGLRCPAHPVALAFLKACNTGVAGPSANRFGRVSPTTAAHVADEFGDDMDDIAMTISVLRSELASLAARQMPEPMTTVDETGNVYRVLRDLKGEGLTVKSETWRNAEKCRLVPIEVTPDA